MANFRQIHVSIWKDPWFLDLEPDEKLLFIYLFSNESTSLAGIYEIAFKVICFETNLSGEFVSKTLDKFEKAEKVYYRDGIVWVKNLRKYNSSRSDKVKTRIESDLESIPDCELKRLYIDYYGTDIGYGYDIDTPSHEEEEEEEDESEEEKDSLPEHPITEILTEWKNLFPDKPQPRATTKAYRDKVKTRWKIQHFRDNWRVALQEASKSPTLQAESWFNFEFFIRNEENYQKCLDHWMAWKDEKEYKARNNGRADPPVSTGFTKEQIRAMREQNQRSD